MRGLGAFCSLFTLHSYFAADSIHSAFPALRTLDALQMDTRLERSLLNQEPERLNDAALRTLDSSLKKTSGFLKKVHALSDATCAALCAELPKLNLSKYVDEVAAAVAEAKLKLADVPAVLQFCSLMHRSYAAFAPALLPLLLKNVALAKPGGPSAEPDSERSGRLARKRVSLRVLFELRAIHVLQRTAPLLQCVKELIAEDLGTSEPQHPNQGVLTSFAKFLAADPLVISASARSKAAGGPAVVQAEEEVACTLSEAEQLALLDLLQSYYTKVGASLQSAHQQLRTLERANQKALVAKGEISEESAAAYEGGRKLHEKLVGLCTALAELLLVALPELQETQEEKKESVKITAHELVITADDAGAFEDAETRAFYEVRRLAHPAQRALPLFRDVRFALRQALPELRSMFPEVLFAEPSKEKANPEDEGAATMFEKTLSRLAHVHSREAADELASELCCHGAAHHRRKLVSVRTLPRAWVSQKRPRLSLTPCCRHLLPRRGSVQSTFPTMAGLRLRRVRRSVMWALSSWLRCARSSTPTSTAVIACSRREPCPAHGSLITMHSPRPHAAPGSLLAGAAAQRSVYGRTPEVRAAAPRRLLRCAAPLTGHANPHSTRSALRGADALKRLLDAFSLQHAPVVCVLLETAGRFLHRKADTQQRCMQLLELIVRLRSVTPLPHELATALENAVHGCKPPECSAVVVERRPPLQQYVVWLLHEHLSKETVEHVLRQLRKLPWERREVERWAVDAVVECASVKYHTIPLVACVASGLYRHQQPAVLRIVDAVIERARSAIERNDFREAQRRACLVRLFGELYNYRLADTPMLFGMLYTLVPKAAGVWGRVVPLMHTAAHEAAAGAEPAARGRHHPDERMADAPHDLGRLRLVCTLLDTCGAYLERGSAKRRLDVYLVYLLRYVFCKARTVDCEFMLSDTLNAVRPELVRPKTYAEACEAVAGLEAATASSREVEALAHELLHPQAGEEDGSGDNCSDDGDEDEATQPGHSAPHASGDLHVLDADADRGADEADAELAELQQQLEQLEVEAGVEAEERARWKDEELEEQQFIEAQTRRRATDQETDLFEKELQSMLEASRSKVSGIKRPPRASTTGLLLPSRTPDAGATNNNVVSLRVITRRGHKHKVDAAEVEVPVEDQLAVNVLDRDRRAGLERQRLRETILMLQGD